MTATKTTPTRNGMTNVTRLCVTRAGYVHMGELTISGKSYAYAPICVAGERVGYTVGQYEVCLAAGQVRCTCPDFVHVMSRTGKPCKHIAAVTALRSAGRL
ncbi:MAG: SWIM zinc finger family protein [Fimbriiglobus sp.]